MQDDDAFSVHHEGGQVGAHVAGFAQVMKQAGLIYPELPAQAVLHHWPVFEGVYDGEGLQQAVAVCGCGFPSNLDC